MTIQNGNARAADLGLQALAQFLRLHGVNAEPDQLRDSCGSETIGIRAMLRCARELGVKVRSHTTHWKRLASIQLPGIASLRDGGFLLLGKVDDQAALVLHPTSSHPKQMTRAEFEEIWDGRLILAGSRNPAQRVLHALAGMSGRGVARRARDPLMGAHFANQRNIAVRRRTPNPRRAPDPRAAMNPGFWPWRSCCVATTSRRTRARLSIR
jgi:ATP-binding cassette, subfamily B, bacterial HlyB/CyaB